MPEVSDDGLTDAERLQAVEHWRTTVCMKPSTVDLDALQRLAKAEVIAATHDFRTYEIRGQTVRFGKCQACGSAPYGISTPCPGGRR